MRVVRVLSGGAAVLVSLLIATAVAAPPSFAIADGIAATSGQYPFATKLTMTNIPRTDGTTYNSACSGALISPTWLITAGHCFHDVNRNRVSGPTPYPTTATLNTVNVTQNAGESRSVVYVRQSSTADVALAQLSSAVTDVTPLSLSKTKPPTGQILTFAGWGATSSVNPTPSDQLYWGRVKISSVKSSTVGVVGYYPAADTSACLYDSGAPYFRTPSGSAPLLVSVESNGPSCPHTSQETTARVDNITNWIASVVTDLP